MIHIYHDRLCPSCQDDTCTICVCLCDLIADVREDERRSIARVLPMITEVTP